MLKRAMLASGLLVAVMFVSAHSAEDEFKATCPVSGKAAIKDCHAEFNGGNVYFCCGNCLKAFNEDNTKFVAKANHQLVATKQAKQVACPLSGQKLNDKTAVSINGVEVTFCCENCQGKVKKSDDQINLVFAKDAFKKAFKVEKK
jgi:YHS domain-containing protein